MSRYIYARYECDEPECDEVVSDGTSAGGVTLPSVARIAKSQGWQVNGKQAYCPKHRTTQLQFHPFTANAGYASYLCSAKLGNHKTCWERADAYIHQEVNR